MNFEKSMYREIFLDGRLIPILIIRKSTLSRISKNGSSSGAMTRYNSRSKDAKIFIPIEGILNESMMNYLLTHELAHVILRDSGYHSHIEEDALALGRQLHRIFSFNNFQWIMDYEDILSGESLNDFRNKTSKMIGDIAGLHLDKSRYSNFTYSAGSILYDLIVDNNVSDLNEGTVPCQQINYMKDFREIPLSIAT